MIDLPENAPTSVKILPNAGTLKATKIMNRFIPVLNRHLFKLNAKINFKR